MRVVCSAEVDKMYLFDDKVGLNWESRLCQQHYHLVHH
jgi:hypothetical protein